MAMEFTEYSLNGLLLCCLRSEYEPEILYETKVTGLQRPLYENRQTYQFSNMALRQAKQLTTAIWYFSSSIYPSL